MTSLQQIVLSGFDAQIIVPVRREANQLLATLPDASASIIKILMHASQRQLHLGAQAPVADSGRHDTNL